MAVKLKDAGFNEPCDYYKVEIPDTLHEVWDEEEQRYYLDEEYEYYPKITLWQAQKWLREKKGIFIWVMPDRHPIDDDFFNDEFTGEWWWDISSSEKRNFGDTYPSYESALSAGISAVLELVNENNKEK